MKDEISTWLQDKQPDYKNGLDLLKKITKNKYLVRSLSLKNSVYTFAKLRHELQKYLGLLPAATKEEKPHTIKKAETPEVQEKLLKPATLIQVPRQDSDEINDNDTDVIDYNQMTEVDTKKAVEKLEVGLSKMYNKKGMLANSLKSFDMHDNEGRKKIIQRIDGINHDMNEVRAKLDYYQKNGKLPPLKQTKIEADPLNDIPDDPIKMKSMLLNERSNRSKYKRQLSGMINEDKRQTISKRLYNSSLIINEIERRLS